MRPSSAVIKRQRWLENILGHANETMPQREYDALLVTLMQANVHHLMPAGLPLPQHIREQLEEIDRSRRTRKNRTKATEATSASPFRHTPPDPAFFDKATPLSPAPLAGPYPDEETFAQPLDIPDDDAVPEHQMTHVERINRPTRGALGVLVLAAGLAFASPFGQAQPARPQPPGAQPPPLTITEAMLGRCTADAAAMREQAQQMLAAAQTEAEAKAAYWAAYVKAPAPAQ